MSYYNTTRRTRGIIKMFKSSFFLFIIRYQVAYFLILFSYKKNKNKKLVYVRLFEAYGQLLVTILVND